MIAFAFFLAKTVNESDKLDLELLYPADTSKVYDVNNNLLFEIGNKKQEYISILDIHPNMLNAIIAIEDERFYKHKGIDLKRLLGAFMNNVSSLSFKEGASTINQQLIKNVYLSNEKTIKRKVAEMYLACNLERYLTKNEILECYLNNVLFGKKIYGIKKASNYYFNVEPKDLTLTMAATLAGMVQIPNYYNPYTNLSEVTKRRNTVLSSMLKCGYITDDEYKTAVSIPLESELKSPLNDNEYGIYSSIIEGIIEECNKVYGLDPYIDGIEIYTGIDFNIQNEIYRIMQDYYHDFNNNDLKCAIVFMDNTSGLINGLSGTRNDIGINYATNVKLQPGSTIKPILDYAPAFEFLNYGTGTILEDFEKTYKTGEKINNWDLKYKGYISLRTALKESRNVPSVDLFNTIGSRLAFKFASRLGIKNEETIYESNAIGGFTNGYTVLEMANAYQAFATEGNMIDAHYIKSIKNDNNYLKYDYDRKVVMKESTAFMVNDILHDVSAYSLCTIDGMYAMGKTGQTNYDTKTKLKYQIPNNATKDSWYIGYTKYHTCAVWTGFDKLDVNCYLNSKTKDIPKNIYLKLMSKYGVYDNNPYEIPKDIIRVKVESIDSKLYLSDDLFAKNEYFIKGNEPTYYKNA